VTLLKRLRKYRRGLAGTLLPVLAFVWVGAAASPCVAMRAGSSGAAEAGGAARAFAPAIDTMSAGGSTMVDDRMPMAHEHASDGHVVFASGGEQALAGDSPCPHCPPAHGHTPPHSACATLRTFLSADDGLAAPARDLGHLLLPIVGVMPLDADVECKERRERPDRRPCPSPSVPLNLRYCVFLH
jgi:hypothetical protein